MSENNQVIEREIEGIKYTFSGLSRDKAGVLEFVNKEEEKQLEGMNDLLKASVVARLYAEHLRQFPVPNDED
tara:strand:- start:3607 stop:3822 length:216 start_codon:yes stop_codon:yes gene_type:complete